MEFQLSYSKSYKMMLWKCFTLYASKFGKLSRGHRTGKGQFFIPIPKKGNAKECSNYCILAVISHASKVMLKILQAWLQQHVNHELTDVQALLEKAEEPEIKLPTLVGSLKRWEGSRKSSTSALLTMPMSLIVWITTNCGKFLKRWEYHLICLLRNLYVGLLLLLLPSCPSRVQLHVTP